MNLLPVKIFKSKCFILLYSLYTFTPTLNAKPPGFRVIPCDVTEFLVSADTSVENMGAYEKRVERLVEDLDRASRNEISADELREDAGDPSRFKRRIFAEFEEKWIELLLLRTWKRYSQLAETRNAEAFAKIFDIQRASIRARNLAGGNRHDLLDGLFEFDASLMRFAIEAVERAKRGERPSFLNAQSRDSTLWPLNVLKAIDQSLADISTNELSVFDIPFCCGNRSLSPRCVACPIGLLPKELMK